MKREMLMAAMLCVAVAQGCKKEQQTVIVPTASAVPQAVDPVVEMMPKLQSLGEQFIKQFKKEQSKDPLPHTLTLVDVDVQKSDSLTSPMVGVIRINDKSGDDTYTDIITVAPTPDGWWKCVKATSSRSGLSPSITFESTDGMSGRLREIRTSIIAR